MSSTDVFAVQRGSLEAHTPLHALEQVLRLHPNPWAAIVEEKGISMRYLSPDARSVHEGEDHTKPLIHVYRFDAKEEDRKD